MTGRLYSTTVERTLLCLLGDGRWTVAQTVEAVEGRPGGVGFVVRGVGGNRVGIFTALACAHGWRLRLKATWNCSPGSNSRG